MWRTNGHKTHRGKPGCTHTPIVGDVDGLPGTMVEQSWCGIALVLGCFALLVFPVEAANNSVDSVNKHSIDRYNSLQLLAEQKIYQQSVGPLSPVDQQKLKQQLHQQRLQQRILQLRQDQRLLAERHKRHINRSLEPYRGYQPGQNSQWHMQQQQRLQMRMQRNTWPYPRNYLRSE